MIKKDNLNREYLLGIIIFILAVVNPEWVYSGNPEGIDNLPGKVSEAIKNAGKSKQELFDLINHYSRTKDSLKLRAAYYLIENMDIHYSADYCWKDDKNNRVDFNELDYPDFKSSLNAFNEIIKTTKVKPHQFVYQDIEVITSEYLKSNIDLAFAVWRYPWNRYLSFNAFCEYILPYRVDNEALQDWRGLYKEKFCWILDSVKNNGDSCEAAILVNADLNKWYVNAFQYEDGSNSLPLQGPLNLLHRKQGDCPNMANMACYAMRSVGIPARVDFAPFWPTSSGCHFWNVTLDHNSRPIMFMGTLDNPGQYFINREFGKVFWRTFSIQKDCIAQTASPEEIPPGFMHDSNIKDVTGTYEKVTDLNISFDDIPEGVRYAFLAVHNNQKWRALFWAQVDKKGNAVFKDMGRGVVYLPVFYLDGELIPAHNPVEVPHFGAVKEISGTSDKNNTITIPEKADYLIYRPGKEYSLYHWANKWEIVGKKIAGVSSLQFKNIPADGLYILVPEYSQGKERIFTVNGDGEIEYW